MRTFQLTVEVHYEGCENFHPGNFCCEAGGCGEKRTGCCFECFFFEECTDKRCDFCNDDLIPFIVTSLKEVEK